MQVQVQLHEQQDNKTATQLTWSPKEVPVQVLTQVQVELEQTTANTNVVKNLQLHTPTQGHKHTKPQANNATNLTPY